MGKDHVRKAFEAAEDVPPIDNGAEAEAPETDDATDRQDGPQDRPADQEVDEIAPEAIGAGFPLNDYGNGQRLVHYYGNDIKHVPRLGWFRWSDQRWLADEDELDVRRDAQGVARKILEEIPHLTLDDWDQEKVELWTQTRRRLGVLERKAAAANRRVKGDDAEELTDSELDELDELRTIAQEGKEAKGKLDSGRKGHRNHARTSGNSGKITNMLLEAKTAVSVPLLALNADPLLVNCENGVLQFFQIEDPDAPSWKENPPKIWKVRLLGHCRSQNITKMMAARYDPKAECPKFLKFLETVQPDPELRAYLQRWFGYSITGLTSAQALAFLYGHGRNGKIPNEK